MVVGHLVSLVSIYIEGDLLRMYEFNYEEFEEVTESCALDQAEIHLERVWQNAKQRNPR